MRFIPTLAVSFLALGLVSRGALAADTARPLAVSKAQSVQWHEDVRQAWRDTQQNGRLLLVFVTRDNCFYCTQMKRHTYSSPLVVEKMGGSFVPLLLNGSTSTPLLRELNVKAYPSTFVISPQAVVLDRIDGYVSPEVLASRLSALRPRSPASVPPDKLASDP